MARTSHVILADNIRMDRDYKNVINYTQAQMLELVNAHKKAEKVNCSFLRDKNSFDLEIPYDTALKCNYIAFTNPYYTNKWFFGWIDKIEFVTEKSTRIYYTIDIWSTWFSSLTLTKSFVIREHVNDDTRGKHTQPENLETGDYIVNSKIVDTTYGGNYDSYCYVLASTSDWNTKIDPNTQAVPKKPNGGGRYNGIRSGAKYYRFDLSEGGSGRDGLSEALTQMEDAGQIENVVGIFMAPTFLCPEKEGTTNHEIEQSLLPFRESRRIGSADTVDGYIPKNNKLFTSPYSYIMVDNGAGQQNIYEYENFENSAEHPIDFSVFGSLCPSCSLKIVPEYYKGEELNYAYSMSGAKYPISSYQSDMYTNWLAVQSYNTIFGEMNPQDFMVVGQTSKMLMSALSGDAKGFVGANVSMSESVAQMRARKLVSGTSQGAGNTGDVSTGLGINTPIYYKMSIKQEYAKIIDDYFTRKGYKINRLKIPNITGRRYWNYIQISADDILGYGAIPQDNIDTMTKIAQNGVTIWHNHDNIGDFTLDNEIIN